MNKFLKQRKGITLISLVVTIIILIILAGVSISLIMGQDGLIEKANSAKLSHNVETLKEQLEMLKAPTQLNTYDVNLDNYLEELDRVKVEYEVNDVEKISNTQAEVVVGGKYKFLIKDKQNGDVEIIYQGEATELILSATSGTYIYPTPGTFEVVKNITGGELSVKSENENIAKATINGNIVTVEPQNMTGTVKITVTSAANGEYAEQRAVHLATVVNGEIELSATAYTGNYDGLPHNAITDVEVIPEDAKIEYSLDGEEYSEEVPTVTGAKGYTVSIRASKVGYTTKTISKTVTIGKAENQSGNLVLSKTEGIITYPTQEKITVSKNISGGDLSISSSNEDIATATIDELTGEITITPKAVSSDGQKTTITVTSSATANYAEQTATYEATVNRGIIEIEATAYTGNYDGSAHDAVTVTKKSPSDVTIKYSIDGGAYSTTMPTVTNVGTYTVSIQASKAGYTTKTISKTVTIDQPLYTVTYNVDTSTSYKESVKKGSTCLSPTTFTPTKSGYIFVGWRTDTTASSTVLTSKVMGDGAISLYAVFKKDVKVTYYNNSTTAATSTKQAYYNNGNVANPSFTLTQATRSGWTARGWSTGTAGNSSISYSNATAFTRSSDVTLYGMYQQTITLSYNGNGATSGSTASQTGTRYYNSGKNVAVNPTFTLRANGFAKTDYKFTKWASSSTSGTQYVAGASVTLSANTTFYACWEPTILYLVKDGAITQLGKEWFKNSSFNATCFANWEGLNNTVTHFTLAEGKTYSKITLTATCTLTQSYSNQWYQFTTSDSEAGGWTKGSWEITRTYTNTSKTSFASKCRVSNNTNTSTGSSTVRLHTVIVEL